jgi:3-isopropylmalate dehydrogenase
MARKRDFSILVLPGDGVGPEVVREGCKVIEALVDRFGHRFELTEETVGGAAIDRYGTPIKEETVQLARRADAVLFGAVGGPKWDDPQAAVRPEQAILRLRKDLGLFANLRPTRIFPALVERSNLKPSALEGVDFIFVRELTGGTYFAPPKKVWQTSRGRRGVDTCFYTEQEIARVVRVGFELARQRRKVLHSIDKANVLATSRLWRQVAEEVGRDYPDVQLIHMLADACAMHMLRRPADFDVLVSDNLFGDMLTDEASMLAGSLGMMPSASLGRGSRGLFEPIHGTAPDIAGQDRVNPLATILSVAMMLRWSLKLPREADAVEQAVEQVLSAGLRTPDLVDHTRPLDPAEGRLVSTTAMGDAVATALRR